MRTPQADDRTTLLDPALFSGDELQTFEELHTTLQGLAHTHASSDADLAELTRLLRTNVQLARARDQALEASRAKTAFLANMSHEMRTPLNAIIGFSEMMQLDAQEAGNSAIMPDLQKIQAASRELLGMIGGILDLSKIEAGETELTRLEEAPTAPTNGVEHQRGREEELAEAAQRIRDLQQTVDLLQAERAELTNRAAIEQTAALERLRAERDVLACERDEVVPQLHSALRRLRKEVTELRRQQSTPQQQLPAPPSTLAGRVKPGPVAEPDHVPSASLPDWVKWVAVPLATVLATILLRVFI